MTIQLSDAMKERDAGIKKVESTTDAIDSIWREVAFELLKRFIIECPGEFKVEDVRAYAAMYDFVEPSSKRVWGSIILRASKCGLVKKMRVEPVTNPNAHCANAGVWIANK